MDYIKPAYCNEAQFRSMWTEFEWENRVNVTTTITYVHLCLCEECFSDLAHQQTGISKATSNTLWTRRTWHASRQKALCLVTATSFPRIYTRAVCLERMLLQTWASRRWRQDRFQDMCVYEVRRKALLCLSGIASRSVCPFPFLLHDLLISSSPSVSQLKKRTRHLYRYNTDCFHLFLLLDCVLVTYTCFNSLLSRYGLTHMISRGCRSVLLIDICTSLNDSLPDAMLDWSLMASSGRYPLSVLVWPPFRFGF